MAINKQALVASIAKFRADTATAVKFHDQDFTHNAITKRRHAGVMAARGELLKSIPAEPTAPGVSPASVVAGLTPTTADQVAVQARELGIVQKLLDAGQPIEQVIRGASPERLAAIAANAEVLPSTLGSSEPHKVIEGIHAQVFDALVESGHPQAVIARDAQAQFDEQAAWRAVVKETIEGQTTVEGLTALAQADLEGFKLLQEANTDPARDADTGERVRQLDRTFGIGVATAGD